MVQTNNAHISGECTEWRKQLRQLRESLHQCRQQLLEIVEQTFSRESLTQVEHFHNQFHIQLINVHDLKKGIKQHEQNMQVEKKLKGKIALESLAIHDALFNQHQQLQTTLQQLVHDFGRFLRRKK